MEEGFQRVAARFKALRDKAAGGGLEQMVEDQPTQARFQIHGGSRLVWAGHGGRKVRHARLDLQQIREFVISISSSAHSG
jgi:hypothetical protein